MPSTEPGSQRELASLDRREQAIATTRGTSNYLEFLPDEVFHEDVVMIATSSHPRGIEEHVRRTDGNLESLSVIPVGDSSLRYDGSLNVASRTWPKDLTRVGVRFTDFVRSVSTDDPWVVVDNLNVFLMYADADRVCRFLETVMGKSRRVGARGVYFTVRTALTDPTYEKLTGSCDRELDLR